MKLRSLATVLAAATLLPSAHAALSAGDLAFTAFNADEDGFSLVTFVDLAPNTQLFIGDNEFIGGAFNTGESYLGWTSGSSTIAAGTVIRFLAVDKTSLSASFGTLSRVTVANSTNYGIGNSNETLYVYQGSSATAPSNFITAITNGSFAADGQLTGTGLVEGQTAIRLNTRVPSATPDYAEYTGPRSGLAAFAGYRPLVADVANWTVDTVNGTYTTTVPDSTAFAVTPVPEPGSMALLAAGLAVVGGMARRRQGRS